MTKATKHNTARARIATALAALSLAATLFVPAIATASAGSTATGSVSAAQSSTYRSCRGTVKQGHRRYRVFRHAVHCRSARKLTRHVLKKKRHPKGWKCSLNLPEVGLCRHHRHVFTFVRKH